MGDPSTFYERSVKTESGAQVEKRTTDSDRVSFISEQDGAAERELKARLAKMLLSHGEVDLAYLAAIQYSDEGSPSVALCLRPCSGASIEKAACASADIFFKMFGKGQRLDIMGLDDESWRELKLVCRPFYARAIKKDGDAASSAPETDRLTP
jgi:hypothetical protein